MARNSTNGYSRVVGLFAQVPASLPRHSERMRGASRCRTSLPLSLRANARSSVGRTSLPLSLRANARSLAGLHCNSYHLAEPAAYGPAGSTQRPLLMYPPQDASADLGVTSHREAWPDVESVCHVPAPGRLGGPRRDVGWWPGGHSAVWPPDSLLHHNKRTAEIRSDRTDRIEVHPRHQILRREPDPLRSGLEVPVGDNRDLPAQLVEQSDTNRAGYG